MPSPIFIAREYITLTLRLYSCIMYVQAKPMRFYRARVFGQAPKFLPKIQALVYAGRLLRFPILPRSAKWFKCEKEYSFYEYCKIGYLFFYKEIAMTRNLTNSKLAKMGMKLSEVLD